MPRLVRARAVLGVSLGAVIGAPVGLANGDDECVAARTDGTHVRGSRVVARGDVGRATDTGDDALLAVRPGLSDDLAEIVRVQIMTVSQPIARSSFAPGAFVPS